MLGITRSNVPLARAISWTALAAAVHVVAAVPAQAQGRSPGVVVEIREGTTDLSPRGTSTHTCILVRSDGRFRLERRIQRWPSAAASANVFLYYLDSSQLEQLRTILDGEGVRRLPEYAQPVLPLGVPRSYGFNARIPDAEGVHSVGYWKWQGGAPSASPNSAPESLKERWRESEAALRPLEDWLHGVEALGLAPSDEKSTMCAVEGEP